MSNEARKAAEVPAGTDKQLEILEVATRYFLDHGYEGTSVSSLSRNAGISKESVYRYFSSKKALFESVIARELAEYERRLEFADGELDALKLEAALVNVAETILAAVCSSRTLALRRLIFQQVEINPDIGRYYYEIGPGRAYGYLERLFERHRERTRFEPGQLARHFVALVLHAVTLQRECGVLGPLTPAQASQHAAQVTDDFLRAFCI